MLGVQFWNFLKVNVHLSGKCHNLVINLTCIIVGLLGVILRLNKVSGNVLVMFVSLLSYLLLF